MKKALGILLIVGLVVGVFATAALAAGPGDGVRDFVAAGSQAGNGHAWGFVDADNDGVNDNFVDLDEDGTCDNFVDLDEDGINDLRGTAGTGGHGPNGVCSGDGFVDEDGDGVCDLAGAGGQQMGGRRHGAANR